MSAQIAWGSILLGMCSFLHLILIVGWVGALKRQFIERIGFSAFMKTGILIGGTLLLLVVSHTLQIWLWAAVLIWLGALENLPTAIYFSLVTYTTLGYGDVILSDAFKLFGAMASVTGLLNFGISTAFLVAFIGKVLPNNLGD
ncbi:ion channel [Cohaesibacter celericrescens]|uniref:Ion transport 2 n=1 Tax=Cohaesibacter celericrescens TaxID=2067669 RepID=A0A2N5XPY4_9HYPH|nr:ion channel [Cohaesibacter celericrescens]PLW76535.1 Ion transport 2 [Cohaesibacter celericrescens]